ncbi:MAG: sortase [Caldilineaceae bacterium]
MKAKMIVGFFGTLLVALLMVALPTRSTAAAPKFTGDATVDFTGPDVIKLNDRSTPDVGMPWLDPPTVTVGYPISAVSGFDMRAVYLQYDKATDKMYVGIDCFVICGDADGDGNPGQAGTILANPNLGGKDPPDFGPGESFGLLIDTNNDYDPKVLTSKFEVVVGVSDNKDLSQIGVYSYTGEIAEQLTEPPWGPKLPFTVTLFASPSITAPDLEFSIANFSKLPGFPTGSQGLPPFKLHMGMGSIVDDGIAEDFSPDVSQPLEITPTPTITPTQPVTPTTPAPTQTPTATLPVTPTPTVTPPTTVTPTAPPTPTPTPLPPTAVPTTGADLSMIPQTEDTTGKVSVVGADGRQLQLATEDTLGPNRLEIPALQLDTAVAEKGWQAVTQKDGTQISVWDDVRNAAGWHKDSALPGAVGNMIFSGHNNVYGSVFRDLYKLKGGETVYIWKDSVRYAYVVDKVKVAPEKYANAKQRADNAAYLAQTDDQRLTLISCWPPNGNSHRVFVTAHLDPERTYIDRR